MNKKLIIALLSITSARQVTANIPNLQDLNIRTVNIADMMRDSEEGRKITNEIEQLHKDLAADIENAQKEFMKETEELKTKFATLSVDAREQANERLIAKRHDIENMPKKAQDKLQYTMQNVSERLTKKAQSVIEKYAEDNKLDVVFDTASGRAVYSSDKADITKSMTTSMNSEYKKELAQNKTIKPEPTKVAAKPAQNKAAAAA